MPRRLLGAGRRWISSAILLEHTHGRLSAANQSTILAASRAGGEAPVGVLAVKEDNSPVVEAARRLRGLGKLLVVTNEHAERLMPEAVADLLAQVQQQRTFSHWWAVHSSIGKDIFPRLAGLLVARGESSVAPIADIIDVKDERTFVRPIYAGNAVATVQSGAQINLITIRPTAFQAPQGDNAASETTACETIAAQVSKETIMSTWVSEELSRTDRPELASAEIVVSGGRALKSADNFGLLYELADALGGAAVGASRAAVDAGYVSNDLQVGQTGKVVAPKLYIAVGISGAIQHVAGMKDSRTIVAINKDADAPIFQIADYGLVGDLFTIIPDLTTKLKGTRAATAAA